jgi:hypothetical protein
MLLRRWWEEQTVDCYQIAIRSVTRAPQPLSQLHPKNAQTQQKTAEIKELQTTSRAAPVLDTGHRTWPSPRAGAGAREPRPRTRTPSGKETERPPTRPQACGQAAQSAVRRTKWRQAYGCRHQRRSLRRVRSATHPLCWLVVEFMLSPSSLKCVQAIFGSRLQKRQSRSTFRNVVRSSAAVFQIHPNLDF